ncbi:MAG: trypsin-like peptidase domain-containing protein [Candidatus Eisenbacteria bacterium]
MKTHFGLAAIVLGAFMSSAGPLAAATPRPVRRPPTIDDSRRSAIVSAAERAMPAVVSISVVTTQVVRDNPFYSFFPDEFFDRFYPQFERKEQLPSLGSGVIVDAQGTVLTNDHVVRNAEEIKVTLPDGRTFPGRVLGESPVYDLAIVAMDLKGATVPVARLGTSQGLIIGEWAIAIGNPFGFLLNDPSPSVTAGVVSAMKRDIKGGVGEGGIYKNMIQTDAAINPGNSGGPLVNGLGEVIGINTFIFTRGGGSLGMGFAIPIDTAKRLLAEVKRFGRIRLAWSGLQVQPVTPYLASRLAIAKPGGLVISRVDAKSPAVAAGLAPGDIIYKVNGESVNTGEDAQRSIFGAGVGDTVRLDFERAGKPLSASLVLAESPPAAADSSGTR